MAAAPLAAAGVGIVSSVLGGKGQKKAAKAAAQIVANDNAANRAFATDRFNQTAAFLSPYQQTGVTANNAIMELLGFGPQTAQQPSAFPVSAGGAPAFGGQPMVGSIPRGYEADSWSPEMYGGGAPASYGATVPGVVTTSVPSARSAFDTYRGSTGYDFRVNEGVRALQAAFSRNLESGGASKAAIRFGQGTASDEFARYMGYLTGQSQMGLSGASALAGVSQNFTNNVVAGNQAAATAAANARLYQGNANANMWNNLGSSFGQGLGAFRGF
jgi:hypothetical protein